MTGRPDSRYLEGLKAEINRARDPNFLYSFGNPMEDAFGVAVRIRHMLLQGHDMKDVEGACVLLERAVSDATQMKYKSADALFACLGNISTEIADRIERGA